MASDPIDVLVVGAGPTGLALALQAADHGATVRIVEQREKQFRPSRALIVNPRTLEVLRPLGVTDALLARGDASPSVELHLRSGIVNAQLGTLDLPDSAFPHLLLIRQSDVEAVLAEALTRRNIEVERGVEIVDITPLPDRGRATTADGGRIDARFVVGCDGPTSVVRTAIGTTWCGRPYRQEVVLADLELGGDLTSGAAHASPGPQGLVFLFSLGEQATWRLLATRSAGPGGSPFGQPGPPVTTAELQALLAGGGLDVRIADVKWSARVPLQHRLAGSYRSGRLFLAGDAAHTHSPAGGQGMNTGIQDAANLGWKLALAARAGDAASAALLDSYEHERRPIARHVLLLTDLVFWTEASTHPLARAARAAVSATGRALLPTLLRRRRLLAEGVRTLGQLRVNYRCSPLSLNGTRAAPGFPRAGARLGDAAVPTPSGARRLHELTATPGIHLFVARDCALPDLDPPPDLVSVHRLAMPGRVLAAIRPDGYVGFSGECSELPLLQRWLALVGAADRSRPLHPSDPALTPG